MKINLGSHNKDIGSEYINADALELDRVDLIVDLSITPFTFRVKNDAKLKDVDFLFDDHLSGETKFKFPDNCIDEIVFEEVLEHLSFRHTTPVLKEIYRILKKGGKLRIQVPDCGKAMEAWVNGKICDCVPHKPPTMEGFKGDPLCPKCKGEAVIGWQRWLFSFLGAQKHFPHDIHKAIFTKDILGKEIGKANFSECIFKEHPVKLKVECIK